MFPPPGAVPSPILVEPIYLRDGHLLDR